MNFIEKSIQVIRENQNPSGSYVACPNFDNYRFCWLRDGSFIAYAMALSGETESSHMFLDWVDRVVTKQKVRVDRLIKSRINHEHIMNKDYLPTRYMLDGSDTGDEWPNHQLDGYGTWLWALCEHIAITGEKGLLQKYENSIAITIEYLVNFWNTPCYDCWEENGDQVHTSTLACIYGGLDRISYYLDDQRLSKTCMDIKSFISNNCTADHRLCKSTGSVLADSSLLWAAVPFKLYGINDQVMVNTVKEIEKQLLHEGGVHRYQTDTYYGGGEWLLLSCWLGLYYIESGFSEKAEVILEWVEKNSKENGEMPEQVLGHVNDPGFISKWQNLWGDVATPLLWSHAMYLVLKMKLNLDVDGNVDSGI